MQKLIEKIVDDPAKLADACRLNRVVFTNGIFDLLHAGHVLYLEAARNLGDLLVVAVNDDISTRQLKGPARPVNCLQDRMTVLAALHSTSYVVPMASVLNISLLRELRPTVWAKGGDYSLDRLNLTERLTASELGIEIRILPFTHGHSTTNTFRKIAAA